MVAYINTLLRTILANWPEFYTSKVIHRLHRTKFPLGDQKEPGITLGGVIVKLRESKTEKAPLDPRGNHD